MKRCILVKVWQRKLTPQQALNKLKRAGPKFDLGQEEELLKLLEALSEKEITTTEAEEEAQYVGVIDKKDLCRI